MGYYKGSIMGYWKGSIRITMWLRKRGLNHYLHQFWGFLIVIDHG